MGMAQWYNVNILKSSHSLLREEAFDAIWLTNGFR